MHYFCCVNIFYVYTFFKINITIDKSSFNAVKSKWVFLNEHTLSVHQYMKIRHMSHGNSMGM